jgi:hypothetical protein
MVADAALACCGAGGGWLRIARRAAGIGLSAHRDPAPFPPAARMYAATAHACVAGGIVAVDPIVGPAIDATAGKPTAGVELTGGPPLCAKPKPPPGWPPPKPPPWPPVPRACAGAANIEAARAAAPTLIIILRIMTPHSGLAEAFRATRREYGGRDQPRTEDLAVPLRNLRQTFSGACMRGAHGTILRQLRANHGNRDQVCGSSPLQIRTSSGVDRQIRPTSHSICSQWSHR